MAQKTPRVEEIPSPLFVIWDVRLVVDRPVIYKLTLFHSMPDVPVATECVVWQMGICDEAGYWIYYPEIRS